jgi:hypothetical protein
LSQAGEQGGRAGRGVGTNGEKPSVHSFYIAALLFSAKLAVGLKLDRKTFLRHAIAAFAQVSRRNPRTVDPVVDPAPD